MSLSTGGIIGVSVSAGVLAIVLVYIVWILHKRKRRTSTWPPSDPEKAASNMTTGKSAISSTTANVNKPTAGRGAATQKSTPGAGAQTKTSTKKPVTKQFGGSGGSGGGGGTKQYTSNARSMEVFMVGSDCGSPAPQDTHSHSNAISRGYHVSDYPVQDTTVTSHSSGHGYSGGYGGHDHGGGGGYGGGSYGGDSGGGGCSSGGGDSGGCSGGGDF